MNKPTYHRLPPTPQDAAIARVSRQALSRFAHRKRPLTLYVQAAEEEKESIELPAGSVLLLMEILDAMAAGQGVTIVPEGTELTTVQAADVLKVSRTFLISLLDTKIIPHRKVGSHRRIRMEDVMAYKTQIDRERESILDELVREAQEQEMGYRRL